MKKITTIGIFCVMLAGCAEKEKLSAPADDGFPLAADPLPAKLVGTWVRTSSLRTFDYKPEEWVSETPDSTTKKRIQITTGKTYVSNQITCSGCAVAWKTDTLFIQHSTGYYKFPVITLNDTLLYLKTKTGEAAYSLPNTGLFDFILEEKYRRLN